MSIQTNNVTYRKGFVILQNTFDEVRVLGDKHQVWFDYDKLMKYYNQLIKYWEEALDTYTNSPKPQSRATKNIHPAKGSSPALCCFVWDQCRYLARFRTGSPATFKSSRSSR